MEAPWFVETPQNEQLKTLTKYIDWFEAN